MIWLISLTDKSLTANTAKPASPRHRAQARRTKHAVRMPCCNATDVDGSTVLVEKWNRRLSANWRYGNTSTYVAYIQVNSKSAVTVYMSAQSSWIFVRLPCVTILTLQYSAQHDQHLVHSELRQSRSVDIIIRPVSAYRQLGHHL